MLFDTPVYFVFLTVVTLVYWRLRHRQQNAMLLATSYFFYAWWDWRFLTLIVISTTVDYWCGHYIHRSENPGRRKLLLTVSVAVNLGFLGVFKYFNFFVDSLHTALETVGITGVPIIALRILLPPGISFYTFQELAYIVDVYNRKLEPARSLLDYALFISLFPHLIAGPIQRPSHLLPQVQHHRSFNPDAMFDGLLLILSGLFRKCVIADNCALIANAAFSGHLGEPSLVVVALGTYAFAWQIYGDFSGYTDIARGSAQLLGFHFMLNFRQPYLATSLQDFWRRWHMSLSTWLRDYLYIALGGNRLGEAKTHRNLLITMLLGGLWHGAHWTFVVWGALHGIGLSLGRFLRPESVPAAAPSLTRTWVSRVVVFHLVCLTWIFFRAPSLRDAVHFLSGVTAFAWRPEFATAFAMLALFTIPLFLVDLVLERRGEEYLFATVAQPYRVAIAVGFLAAVVLFAGNQVNAFIYFQF